MADQLIIADLAILIFPYKTDYRVLIAEVSLSIANIVILFLGPWVMDQALVMYSWCILAVYVMLLP